MLQYFSKVNHKNRGSGFLLTLKDLTKNRNAHLYHLLWHKNGECELWWNRDHPRMPSPKISNWIDVALPQAKRRNSSVRLWDVSGQILGDYKVQFNQTMKLKCRIKFKFMRAWWVFVYNIWFSILPTYCVFASCKQQKNSFHCTQWWGWSTMATSFSLRKHSKTLPAGLATIAAMFVCLQKINTSYMGTYTVPLGYRLGYFYNIMVNGE